MKLYFADPVGKEITLLERYGGLILKSFIEFSSGLIPGLLRNKFFLDCGAFSVFTNRVKSIDLDAYMRFIFKNRDRFSTYAALDVIGDVKKTWENYEYMRKYGLNPIPTFHTGEELAYLGKYMDKTDYVAIGGLVAMRHGQKIKKFLNKVFYYIPKNFKLHGFGLASDILLDFPFYSSDSSSWLFSGSQRQSELWRRGVFKRVNLKKPPKDSDYESLRCFLYRDKYKTLRAISVQEFLKFEKYVTELWIKRGIVWE